MAGKRKTAKVSKFYTNTQAKVQVVLSDEGEWFIRTSERGPYGFQFSAWRPYPFSKIDFPTEIRDIRYGDSQHVTKKVKKGTVINHGSEELYLRTDEVPNLRLPSTAKPEDPSIPPKPKKMRRVLDDDMLFPEDWDELSKIHGREIRNLKDLQTLSNKDLYDAAIIDGRYFDRLEKNRLEIEDWENKYGNGRSKGRR